MVWRMTKKMKSQSLNSSYRERCNCPDCKEINNAVCKRYKKSSEQPLAEYPKEFHHKDKYIVEE